MPRWRSSTATNSGPGVNTWPTPAHRPPHCWASPTTTRPLHIGALLGNTPDMLTAMAAAGLGGYVLCGINNTRRGAALARDIVHADCQILLTDADHRDLLTDLDLPGVRVLDVGADEWAALLAGAGPLTPHHEAGAMDTFMLIFTSGTSGDPKAVQVPHITVLMAGTALADRFRVTAADVCYLSMPLFHSNALLAGWSVAVESGAAMVPAAFSASGLIDDVRRYGVTYMNYVGKPLAYVLATPQRPDDRRQFAADRLRQRGQRPRHRGVRSAIRLHGLGRLRLDRGCGDRDSGRLAARPGRSARGFPGVAIYDPDTLAECPRRSSIPTVHSPTPTRRSASWSIPPGAGMFQGYYKDASATDERLRNGIYWSGDLAYRGCRRLDLSGRAHVRLDESRRREHGHGADRADTAAAGRHQSGHRVRRARRAASATR